MSGELARARAAAGRALRRGREGWRSLTADGHAADDAAASAAEVARLEGEVARLRGDLAAHSAWLTDLEAGIGDVRDAHGAQLEDVSKWLGSAILTLSSLSTTPVVTSPALQAAAPPAVRADELAVLRRQLQVWAVQAFLQGLPDELDTHITVIMPSRNRASYLRQAIATVLGQRHRNFELLVVDDGSEDETPDVLAAVDDPRVRVIRTPGLGESAARNLGLAEATGSIITFLDDDNLMDPGWLHAVAWAFDRWPETQVALRRPHHRGRPGARQHPVGGAAPPRLGGL